VALFAVALVIVFAKPLLSNNMLSAPDAPLRQFSFGHADLPALTAGGWICDGIGDSMSPYNISPNYILMFLLQPEHAVLWLYIVNAMLLFLAAFCFLSVLGLSKVSSLVGAIAMAFSTHTFTLVSAGHMSKNGMMPFAVLSFAALRLAVTRRSFFWFAVTGVMVGTGIEEHYDVMFMFCLLAGAYGIFKFIEEFMKSRTASFVVRVMSGAFLAVAVAIAVSLPGVMFISGVAAPNRDAAVDLSNTDESSEKQWEFATNWSLPPEEIFEFIVPAIYGYENGNSDTPYWGRTGQSLDWEKTHQGLRNLRQHGLYLGVVQLVFAMLALVCAIRRKTRADTRGEILFWGVAWVASVLFALGRYGPLYWLFYKFVPYGANARGPIKFMHLIELCTVVLFAYGLDHLLSCLRDRADAKASKRNVDDKPCWYRFPSICFMSAGVVLLAMIILSARQNSIAVHLSSMGFEEHSTTLFLHMFAMLFRTAVMFAATGVIFLVAGRCQGKPGMLVLFPLLVACIVTLDMGSAAFPYVKVEDTRFIYSSNALVDKLAESKEMFRVVTPVGDPLSQQMSAATFPVFNIQVLNPPQGSSIESTFKRYYLSIGHDVLRFWQLGNGMYVFGPREAFAQLMRHPAFHPVYGVSLVRGQDGQPQMLNVPVDQAQYVLLRNESALPRALVYHNWEAVDGETVFARLPATNWNPRMTVLVEGIEKSQSAGEGPTAAKITKYEPTRVEIDIDNTSDGILLLNDRYDERWEVQVNGRKAKLLRCNGIMRGVRVPAGKVTVTFLYHRPYLVPVFIKVACLCIVLAWALVRLIMLWLRNRNAKGDNA
jgi:hypothetical protein